ncbi:MAG TPA: hypothetical protein VHV55_17095 [Pirellulales bacterium]|nr:hypothetical protein [Pirellulales bacterium]
MHRLKALCPIREHDFFRCIAAGPGAALAGIRSQGEFHRVARRSEAMAARLDELRLEMASVPTRADEPNSVRLNHCARRVAQLMINEMLDWRVVFQDRPLGLPA